MKKCFVLICILIFAITLFCSCGGNFEYIDISGDGFNAPTVSPYKSQTVQNKSDATFTVYVCGAVQKDGYYVVDEGKTVADVVARAGLLPQTVMPENATSIIKSNCQIAVRYCENDKIYDCLNVNGMTVQFNLQAENISAEIIAKINAYYHQNGAITNKQVLAQILTAEEYAQNHYKFFVQESDYEKID